MFSLLTLNKYYKALLVLLLSSCYMQNSVSSDFESFQIHGFVNQGYFLSSANNVYGKSSAGNGSLGLSEIGINASIHPFRNLGFAIQGIYRRAGAISSRAQIDFALLDWTIYNSGNTQAGIRLGRIKNPTGLYNETRDIAFTRPSILLPQGMYYERLRNLYLSADGVQLYLEQFTDIGEFSLQANMGKPIDDKNELEVSFLGFDAAGSLQAKTSYLLKLLYESNSGATRLAMTYIELDLDYHDKPVDIFTAGDISIELLILSAQQHIADFTLTGEYSIRQNSVNNFGPVLADFKTQSESYYIQGDYQLSPEVQLSLRYDVAYNNKDDKNGVLFSAATGQPKYNAFTKDSMLAVRWMPVTDWMLRAEYHRIHGTSTLAHADNPNSLANQKDWDLFALQLSYRF